EKLIFHISVGVEPNRTALSNGILQGKTKESGKVFWHYQMQQPMSSYLVMLTIGDFVKQESKTASGTPLEYYLEQTDAALFEPTYRHTESLFDFMEKEIGIPYPWKLYRQVPVRDFLYSGMENTTSTIFAQDFVVDEIGYNDKTYTNVNAHELAHQWFGNLVTAQSGKHHWLQEGFATYYALLSERHLFGDDFFYLELYEMAERLQRVSRTDTIPILNEKASSLTFYQKGAWAVHVLREQMGKEAFQKAVKSFLKKYAYSTATTDQFLSEVQKVSKVDVQKFKRDWLETPGFRIHEAIGYLKKNGVVARYLELIEWQEIPFEDKSDRLLALLHPDSPEIIQQEVLEQLLEVPYEQKKAFLLRAFRTGSLKVRQTLAQTVTEIPEEILPFYESLLQDTSYLTKEIALGTLWRVQPDKRSEYLNLSKDWVGFHDKNLRILWLTLALITPDYDNEQKVYFYDELLRYASSKYTSSVRQNALTNLLYLNPNDQNVLKHLVNATTHHKWQFTLFARNQLRELIKSEPHKKFLSELLSELNKEEKKNLNRLLED
ncbi:MAG: M1 family metallopeptidase, partial [Flavobacterium sp.]